MQAIFDEYEHLTLQSGLMINADKTEIMNIGGDNRDIEFNIG